MTGNELQYYTILTNKGVEYEMACRSTQSAFHITHIAVGDGNGSEITPSAVQTSLVHEVQRYAVFNEECDIERGLYYATIQIPASDGGFTIRELGGYNANGDLVMVAKFPPTEKRVQLTGDYRRTFIRMDLSTVSERTFPSVIDSSLAFPSTEYMTNKLTQLSADLTNDTDGKISDMLEAIYPVGAIYVGLTETCPIAALITDSTWELITDGLTLQQANSTHTVGTEIPAGLPNLSGSILTSGANLGTPSGVFTRSDNAYKNRDDDLDNKGYRILGFDASGSNTIYGQSNTVQPPAFAVNIWRRTA